MAEDMQERVRPLDSEEIKIGVAQEAADAVFDAVYTALGETCNLYGRSYPKFQGSVSIHLELDDFGEKTEENRTGSFGNGTVSKESKGIDAEAKIGEMPPNEFRMQTDQDVTKTVVEDGVAKQAKVKYKPRKKRKNKTRKPKGYDGGQKESQA